MIQEYLRKTWEENKFGLLTEEFKNSLKRDLQYLMKRHYFIDANLTIENKSNEVVITPLDTATALALADDPCCHIVLNVHIDWLNKSIMSVVETPYHKLHYSKHEQRFIIEETGERSSIKINFSEKDK